MTRLIRVLGLGFGLCVILSTTPAAGQPLKGLGSCNDEFEANKQALRAAKEKKNDFITACRALPLGTVTPIAGAVATSSDASFGHSLVFWAGSDADVHRRADIAVICQAILALIAAVIAFMTLKGSGKENRKWKTLEICGQYELNARISDAADELRRAFSVTQIPTYEWKVHRDAAVIILNFLDGIAIGVRQGLYIERLAKDHLRSIVETHVTNLLDSTRQHQIGLVRNNFRFLVDMNQEWTRDNPYFRAEWRRILPYY